MSWTGMIILVPASTVSFSLDSLYWPLISNGELQIFVMASTGVCIRKVSVEKVFEMLLRLIK